MSAPEKGARYVKRGAPDKGRIVTVSRVWKDDDGLTAVAYEWNDRGSCFSACPLDVFHRTYRPETGPSNQSEVMRLRWEIHAAVGNECQIQHWLDKFEKAVAHELAEKQRAAEAQWRQSGYEGTRRKGWLIDLIDPEVSTDG